MRLAAAAAVALVLAALLVFRRGGEPDAARPAAPTATAAPAAPAPPVNAPAPAPAAPSTTPPPPPALRRLAAAERAEVLAQIAAARARRTAAPPPAHAAAPTGGGAADDDDPPMSVDAIRDGVKAVLPLLAECYDQALPHLPVKRGKVIVHMRVTGEPDVGTLIDRADLESPEHLTDDHELADCLHETMMSVELPPLPEGGVVEITYPMSFSDDGDDEPPRDAATR